jgi:hypothetical protein
MGYEREHSLWLLDRPKVPAQLPPHRCTPASSLHKEDRVPVSNTNLLEDLVSADQVAAEVHKHIRTINRWMDEPDGLPFVRLGRKRYVHIPTARQWILARMRRPNPTRRRKRGAAA